MEPVNVILSDNAWELGLGILKEMDYGFAALSRRKYWEGGTIRKRFSTLLPPQISVSYRIYIEQYSGIDWQDGLRKIFREKYLYDLDDFDQSLYEREDLQWIRKAYAMHLLIAWDKNFYSAEIQRFKLLELEQKSKGLFGGNNVTGIMKINWSFNFFEGKNFWMSMWSRTHMEFPV